MTILPDANKFLILCIINCNFLFMAALYFIIYHMWIFIIQQEIFIKITNTLKDKNVGLNKKICRRINWIGFAIKLNLLCYNWTMQ